MRELEFCLGYIDFGDGLYQIVRDISNKKLSIEFFFKLLLQFLDRLILFLLIIRRCVLSEEDYSPVSEIRNIRVSKYQSIGVFFASF